MAKKKSKPEKIGNCRDCNSPIFGYPGTRKKMDYSCDCRKWRSRALALPRTGRSMGAIMKKFEPFITLAVEDGLSLQMVLIGARKQYVAKHSDSDDCNDHRNKIKTETRALRLNDVANILRSKGYDFEGMDKPFVQWVPKGTEIVRAGR